MNSKRMLILGTLVIIVVLLGVTNVIASGGAPGQLNYQGFLLNPTTGDPVPDGIYTLTFAIYDDATSTDPGHRLWEETLNVSTQDGLFNVMLGVSNPINTTWVDGRDLWLGITVQGESEMTPRQQLVSVPYALYASGVPWSGLTGLSCTGGQIVEWNGSAWACGDDDIGGNGHNHLGQTWTGSNNPLVINGTFNGTPNRAPLILNNSYASGDGLRVTSAGRDGVYIGAADYGLHVVQADNDGVYVVSADGNGISVGSAENNGMYVYSADDDGVSVYSADDDGVSVASAGSPSTTNSSASHNGFEVAGAEGNGLFVGQADEDGVYVTSAGTPSTTVSSPSHNGFEVAGAQGSGLRVGWADDDGVFVYSAGNDGVAVLSAGDDGVVVSSAGGDGVVVNSAGGYAGNFNGDVRVTGQLDVNGPAVGFFPRPTWSSGWEPMGQGHMKTMIHNVGGDPSDYFVDLQCKNSDGISIRGHGYYHEVAADGFYYSDLTATGVLIVRELNDAECPQMRVRIWYIR